MCRTGQVSKTENVILIVCLRYDGGRLSSYRCAQSLPHGHIVLGRYARGPRLPSSEISLPRLRLVQRDQNRKCVYDQGHPL